MTPKPHRRRAIHRTGLAALAAVVVLCLAGVGTAHAGWSTSASTSGLVGSGTLSLTQSGADGLTVTYGTSSSQTAPITVTNRGVPASYSLALLATDTSSDLMKAITLRTWPKAGADCQAMPTLATTSTWAAGTTVYGDLAAGASAVICVRTSLPVAANTSKIARTASARSTLSAHKGAWTFASEPVVATQAVPGDTTAPEQPTGLTASSVTDTASTLTWTKDADAAQYVIARNGVRLGTTTGAATFADTGLAVGATYSYTVYAVDAAGNASASSAALSVQTKLQAGGWYRILSSESQLCVTASHGVLGLATCSEGSTQEWGFTLGGTASLPTYTVGSLTSPQLIWSSQNGNNSAVNAVAAASVSNSDWSITSTAAGLFSFRAAGRDLTATSSSLTTANSGQAGQLFSLTRVN